MFLAGIKLRIKKPRNKNVFKIPGGIKGLCLVAGIGLNGVVVTLGISFIPPNLMDVGGFYQYELTLLGGLLLMCLPPFIMAKMRP